MKDEGFLLSSAASLVDVSCRTVRRAGRCRQAARLQAVSSLREHRPTYRFAVSDRLAIHGDATDSRGSDEHVAHLSSILVLGAGCGYPPRQPRVRCRHAGQSSCQVTHLDCFRLLIAVSCGCVVKTQGGAYQAARACYYEAKN